MNRISVTVDQANNAFLLAEWLENIRFVKKVDVKIDEAHQKGNAGEIMKMLNSIKSNNMFAGITNPVAYQRELRDEWEREYK